MPQLDAEKEDSRGTAVLFSGFFAFRGGVKSMDFLKDEVHSNCCEYL